jgi:DNA-binding MarR family transcriptional regulator
MNYALLKNLVELLEEFQENNTSDQLKDFVIWLNNRIISEREKDAQSAHDDLQIAFKIISLSKKLKKETKLILSKSRVFSLDEYSFLLHLNHQESFRKMEIIALHNLEAPTGIEIIKRLLKNELVEEFIDEEDKRAKRIKITASGIAELKKIKPAIDSTFSHFIKDLTLQDKIHVSGILNKLF